VCIKKSLLTKIFDLDLRDILIDKDNKYPLLILLEKKKKIYFRNIFYKATSNKKEKEKEKLKSSYNIIFFYFLLLNILMFLDTKFVILIYFILNIKNNNIIK